MTLAASRDPEPDGESWEPFAPEVYDAGGEYVAVLLRPHHAIDPRLEVAGSAASACRGGLVVGSVTTSGRQYGAHRSRAVVWDPARSRVRSLHPQRGSVFYDTSAEALAAGAGRVVAAGFATWPIYADDDEDDRVYRPVVWSGGPESLIDLLDGQDRFRSGWATSVWDSGGDGGYVVGGYASARRSGGGFSEAALWRMSAGGAPPVCVPLHPPGFAGGSRVNAVGGAGYQAGCGCRQQPDAPPRALLWRGSGESVVDLDPASLPGGGSEATALGEAEEDGGGGVTVGDRGDGKALLWHVGPAASETATPVVLHPAGFRSSGVTGVRGDGLLVGYGAPEIPGEAYPPNHALLWRRGTPEGVVDLHLLLPPECHASVASGIAPDGSGTICGSATLPYGPGPSTRCAVLWLPRDAAPLR